jgi:hypothetical protein
MSERIENSGIGILIRISTLIRVAEMHVTAQGQHELLKWVTQSSGFSICRMKEKLSFSHLEILSETTSKGFSRHQFF